MKRYFSKITFAVLACLVFQACDKGFVQMNTNPNASTTPNPSYIFTKAELDGAGNHLILLQGTMQYTTSFNDVAGFGAKYILSQNSQSWGAFTNGYPDEINEISTVVRAVTGDATNINLLAEARIWRAYCFSRLTDLYGDIPYSEAGKGYTEAVYKPVYDTQQSIYLDILKELTESAASLDPAKPTFAAADLIYSGNTTQWKKFAYSLMLRMAMRMTKVDPTLAQTWAQKAIAGGVITADADIVRVGGYVPAGQDINKNPLALNMINSDYAVLDGVTNPEGGKFQDVFINYLKANTDPRLGVLSVVYVNGTADTTAAVQKGMSATLGAKPADFVTYSQPNPLTLLQLNSPLLLLTNAETNFLLAEAVLRGWYSGGSASSFYESGIRASMNQWALFGAAGTITANQTDSYIRNHPLNTGGSLDAQMAQIYTQFWVGVYPDFQEVFASYRRTGYPALVPNNYVGNATGGQIFRRMEYPVSEQNLNGTNYAAAVARQGADDFMTRMWWDKQ
ncbi:SusD/RagB family nutrient-binding outer membrane lipoprotein [Pedobacter sp. L105]|uniref:SusD/RagB family nutrient-binding outer membrane lipoprotein n=1 Tax=Pedobacter sp. L105 TaxID=1641871 RepID=UPI00131DCD53|nr:SusD/RagB family nutrient-binding outer membrane lipoprotein [Pedobacter sp. L105]